MPGRRETTVVPSVLTGAACDVGLVRANNEDGIWLPDGFLRDESRSASAVFGKPLSGVFLAVADGVGGAAAGEIASRFVLERMASDLSEAFTAEPGSVDEPFLKRLASKINGELLERAVADRTLSGMATTLTGIVVDGEQGWWINAGDSRLYGLRDGRLVQISRDHTLREMTGDASIPGNIITNCFGGERDFYLDCGPLEFADRHVYLLCTDGLSDYAEHSTIEAVLQDVVSAVERNEAGTGDQTLLQTARRLVEAAKSGGGGDNVSALVAVYRGT